MTQAFPTTPTLAAPDRRMGARDIQTLLLASLGGALEFYDFVVFVFFALPQPPNTNQNVPKNSAPKRLPIFTGTLLARFSGNGSSASVRDFHNDPDLKQALSAWLECA